MLNSKLLIVLGVIALILLLLYLLGRKSVHHEIQIDASPEKVWTVLLDTDSYAEWNPVMKVLEGEIKEGNRIRYEFTQDAENISEIPSIVKGIVPNQLLHQGGGLPLVITFDHRYIIEAEGGGTNLIIHEDYRGIWVNFWNPAPVQVAYERLCEGIKNRVETL